MNVNIKLFYDLNPQKLWKTVYQFITLNESWVFIWADEAVSYININLDFLNLFNFQWLLGDADDI